MSEIQHGECALKVDGLRVGYGDLVAVWDVSLEVYAGKTTALVGRNGAGKTTLLGGIAGLLPAKSGSVTLLGDDVSRLPSWRRVSRGLSLVQEGKRVFRKITVRENLVLGLRARRVSRMQIDSELDRIYERFPVLAERRSAVAGSLSGGQQQMLAIGTALAADPKVILVDEPSSGLAPVFVDRVFEVLDALRNEGMAILLVEQLVEEVLQGTADHVVVLEQGRVTLSDEAANVSADAVARSIYASA